MLTSLSARLDGLLALSRVLVMRSVSVSALARLVLIVLVVGAAAGTALLLPPIFGVEEDSLRLHVLYMLACGAALLALLAQVLLRIPVVWLVDLRPLLSMPFAFFDLLLLRLLMSTGGVWLVGASPAVTYLLVWRSGGPGHFALTLIGVLVLVWTLGRVATILSSAADRMASGTLGAVALLLALVSLYAAIHLVGAVGLGEAGRETVETWVANSVPLALAGYTPPGLLVRILSEPGEPTENVLRLGAMLAILVALTVVESRVLLRGSQGLPRGSARSVSALPLAALLRNRRLRPSFVLALVEGGCLLRHTPARLCVLVCCGFGLVQSIKLPTLGVPCAVFLLLMMLHNLRAAPAGCYLWKESVTLPLASVRVFRTPGTVVDVIAGMLLAGLTAVSLTWSEELRGLEGIVTVCMALSIIMVMGAGVNLAHAIWPQRQIASDSAVNVGAELASGGAVLLAASWFGMTFVVDGLLSEADGSGRLVAVMASGLLVASLLLRFVARSWQRRVLREGVSHYLPDEDPNVGTLPRELTNVEQIISLT